MLIGRGIDATNAANTKLDMKTFKKLMLIKSQVTDEMNSGREKQIDDRGDLLAVNSVWIRKSTAGRGLFIPETVERASQVRQVGIIL